VARYVSSFRGQVRRDRQSAALGDCQAGRDSGDGEFQLFAVWRKETVMPVESCIPIIPSANLEKSLRLWVDALGFSMSSEMCKDDKLTFCMLRKDDLCFMLNQRAGTPVKPEDYEGIRLYWAPKDIHKSRERLKSLGYGVSELEDRDYGQTEFVLTDDDGYSHCFGVPTQR
jgi:uncharacterized glyoxalase superfamily protein PhnB